MPVDAVKGGSSRGTALFVEQDSAPRIIRRRIKHACTLEEWQQPGHRAAKIAEAWKMAVGTIGAEGQTFIAPAPVTLYRDPLTGRVKFADIRHPGADRPQWIDPFGTALLGVSTAGLVVERTSYMHWAEGPLAYTGDPAKKAPDPFADRNLQYIRHQNRALRAVIDASIAGSQDPISNDLGKPGWVDLRVRGYFSMAAPRVFDSKQTNEAAVVKLDGQMIDADALGT